MSKTVLSHLHTYKKDYVNLAILFSIAFFLRIFLFHTEFWRSPDPIEYINVAKNINAGLGLTQSIKWFFFTSSPVVTSAFEGKPLLTSFIFALLLKIHNDVYFLQFFELLLMSVNMLLFYALAKQFYSSTLAFFISLLIAVNPNLLITNRLLLSEPISTCFALCFFILYFAHPKNSISAIFLGMFSALAFLTRFEGIFLLITFLIFQRKQRKLLLVCSITFLIITSWYFFLNFSINHSLFYSYNSFHFKVFHFSDGMWEGYGKKFPATQMFIHDHFLWIARTIFALFFYNIKTLIGFSFLGIYSLLFLFVSKKILYRFAPLYVFSLFNILMISIVWSEYAEPERHLVLSYLFLMLPLLSIPYLQTKKFLFITLVGCMLVVYLVLDIHRIIWARTTEPLIDNWGMENKKSMYTWVSTHTAPTDIIAASNPWMMYLFTNRPSVMLPALHSTELSSRFISEFQVKYILTQSATSYLFASEAKRVASEHGMDIYCTNPCNR